MRRSGQAFGPARFAFWIRTVISNASFHSARRIEAFEAAKSANIGAHMEADINNPFPAR
jgi:hypothetical protein